MKAHRSVRLAVACAFCFVACKRPPANEGEKNRPSGVSSVPSGHVDEQAHAEIPRHVRLAPEAVVNAKITTAPVGKEALVATLSLPGEVASDPDRTAKISSPVAGRIDQVSFREWSTVKKGDVLAMIRVPELGNIRSAYTAALAKAKAARANASRFESLLGERLASEQAFRDADAQAEALEAESRSLGEQLTGLGAGAGGGSGFLLALRAAINGTVISRDAVVGQPITADKTLGSIAELAQVWFLGRVFEKDLSALRIGAPAEVRLNAYPDRHFPGEIQFIGQQIDPSARTLTARVVLDNPEGLIRIGLFGTAQVAKGTPASEPRLVVARSALVDVAGKSVVFVKQPDGDFEMHDVVLGESAVGKVEVVSGLREGEQVVVSGAFTLKSAVLRSVLNEEE